MQICFVHQSLWVVPQELLDSRERYSVSISNSLAHYLQPFQLLNHVHRHVHVVNVHVTCDNVWHQQLTGTLQETYSLHKQN